MSRRKGRTLGSAGRVGRHENPGFGGAGSIGSVVTADLIAVGNQVVAYDNLCTGANVPYIKMQSWLLASSATKRQLKRVIREHNVSGVMHFTASIEVGESMKVPEKYFRNNTCQHAGFDPNHAGCGVTKTVFSSTAALYGNPKWTPISRGRSTRSWTNVSRKLVESVLSKHRRT